MAFFSTDEIAILSGTTVRSAIILKFDFVSGAKYVWNGETELVIDGNDVIPLYGLGRMEGLRFSREPVSERFTAGVEGVPETDLNILALALSETDEVEGQTCIVMMQLFDVEWQPVGSPVTLGFGFMRKPKVTRTRIQGEQGPVQSIAIPCENMFYNRSLPPAGRYTDRDQQARYSGDLILQFQPELRAKLFLYPDY